MKMFGAGGEKVRWGGSEVVFVGVDMVRVAPGEVIEVTKDMAEDLCREGRSQRFEPVDYDAG